MEIELDIGIAGEKGVDVRGDVQAAERRRRGDLELPARLGVAAADEVLGLLHQAQDVDDALEIPFPGLGQRQLAGRALEQPGAEALFQQAHAFRNDSR